MTDPTDTEAVNTGTNVIPLHPPDPDAIDASGPAGPAPTRREWVDCKLTVGQRAALGDEMAEKLADIDASKANWKIRAKSHREGLKHLEEELREAQRGIQAGEMRRFVEVRDEPHDLNMATVVVETGKVVRTRPLTDAERQLQLKTSTADTAEETGIGRKRTRKPRKAPGSPAEGDGQGAGAGEAPGAGEPT